MSNLTKAITMAAGVLISIILITILVVVYTKISNLQNADLKQEEAMQIAQFNQKYTKYLNKYLYGAEVITIINKGIEEKVTVIIDSIPQNDYIYSNNAPTYTQNKYKCTQITHDKGKVKTITLIKIIETP